MELTPVSFGMIALGAFLLVIFAAWLSRKGVFAPPFERRPLMNQTELRLFKILRGELPAGWSVMCQVSYGAFLRNKSFKRYMSVNSKRADFAVLDADLHVAAVVEYQGGGHFGNSRDSRARAENSDAVKRQALCEAGIALIELPAKFDRETVTGMIQTLITQDDKEGQRMGVRP